MAEGLGIERACARGWVLAWLLAASALTVVGCTRQASTITAELAPNTIQLLPKLGVVPGQAQPRQDRTLAYEHTISIEISKDLLPTRIKEVRAACDMRKELACTLLDVSSREEFGVPSAHVRMRVAPTGVEALIEIASRGGHIAARSTHAEDLAEPIADTERELSLLSTHRDRLSGFLERKDLKVDQIIGLSKELSSTQTQIDTLNTQKANLLRRTNTELLNLDLSLPSQPYTAEQTPIWDALRTFGSNLGDAVAQVIRFSAFLLPWLIIVVPGIVLLRLFWRWITRWLARRELSR